MTGGTRPERGALGSLLLVPGDDRAALDRALASGADALVVDVTGAPGARQVAASFLVAVVIAPERPLVHVRVHDLRSGLTDRDLAAVLPAAPDGIVLPRALGGRDVQHLAAKLAVAEAEAGIPVGRTSILAFALDSAAGLLAAGTLAGASPRLSAIGWDAADLAVDLGATASRDERGHLTDAGRHARTLCLAAATVAGVAAIDAACADGHDLDALARECRDARRDGFAGKMAVHPAQVPVIREAFR